jgi:hypothetical protein
MMVIAGFPGNDTLDIEVILGVIVLIAAIGAILWWRDERRRAREDAESAGEGDRHDEPHMPDVPHAPYAG